MYNRTVIFDCPDSPQDGSPRDESSQDESPQEEGSKRWGKLPIRNRASGSWSETSVQPTSNPPAPVPPPVERRPPAPALPKRAPPLISTKVTPLNQSRIVWVDGLHPSMTSQKLRRLFELEGMLQVFDVQPSGCFTEDPKTTFAKVRFYSHEDARMAAHHLNGTIRDGLQLNVGQSFDDPVPAPPQRFTDPGQPTPNVQITYLPITIREAQIREHFSTVGEIIDVEFSIDLNGDGPIKFGQAAVMYNMVAEAQDAVETFNGTILMNYWRVQVNFRQRPLDMP